MLRRSRREDLLIERFWAALRGDRKAAPPPELDPRLVVVLQRLEDEVQPPEPADAFVQQLWRTLDSRADELNLRDTTTTSTRAWSGPAVDFNSKRPARPAPAAEPEDQIMTASTDQPVSLEKRRLSKELWKIAAAIAIFALVGAVLVLLLRNNDDEPTVAAPVSTATTLASPSSDATATIDPTRQAAITSLTETADTAATANANLPPTGDVVAEIPVGTDAQGMAATDNAIWVANASDGTVSRIDPATNAIVATVQVGPKGGSGVGGSPKGVVVFDGQVWADNNVDGEIVRIDPATNQVVQSIPVLPVAGQDVAQLGAFVVDATGIWITDGERLLHIDATTGAVLGDIPIKSPLGVASGFGSIWVMTNKDADSSYNTIVRVDPVSNLIISEIKVEGGEGFFVAAGVDAIWASDWSSGIVTRIDPISNAVVATIDTGLGTGHAILAVPSGVWVSSIFSPGVVRIDPTTNQAGQIIADENGGSVGLTELDGTIWASQNTVVLRIDPAP